ncbi:OsmC family protein [Desulfosporosinus nitroreducens]|uniref:OsmC family protein n=1 Tax=Desulfosporosinus nitroreducens TaxID=2018668 RepID=UPI00207C86C4|nr:OsmC family protein [Desulfosporosinus nitroreducens]MCO1604624.1 OsmC family protein [Desulfosporosinus nitroreducens]
MDEPFGTNEGPQPGEMILAALGACLVVGYTFDGALHNIELKKVAIEVEEDVVSTKFFQILSDIIPNLSNNGLRLISNPTLV